MQHSGQIPVINKIIAIKNDLITIRYRKQQLYYNFYDVNDIKLTKMKVKKNIVAINLIGITLTLFPIAFYYILNNIFIILAYAMLLLVFLHFKSNRYEQAYYLKITLHNGQRHRIKIQSKDRLDIIREITSYIDYRFKKSMQELFMDMHQNKHAFKTNVS